jgi:hypothetical protein
VSHGEGKIGLGSCSNNAGQRRHEAGCCSTRPAFFRDTPQCGRRRFTHLTNAFSKKLENLQAAVALHFAHYNPVRVHKTLRVTPAMAANVTDRLWSLEELVKCTSN